MKQSFRHGHVHCSNRQTQLIKSIATCDQIHDNMATCPANTSSNLLAICHFRHVPIVQRTFTGHAC